MKNNSSSLSLVKDEVFFFYDWRQSFVLCLRLETKVISSSATGDEEQMRGWGGVEGVVFLKRKVIVNKYIY